MPNIEKLYRVKPSLDELLPTPETRATFDEVGAALEAAQLVREFRKKAGLNQIDLAARLSISQARVSAIESGEGRDGPSYGLLKRIALACGISWPPPLESNVDVRKRRVAGKRYPTFYDEEMTNLIRTVDTKGHVIGKVVEVNVASAGRMKTLGVKDFKFDANKGVIVVKGISKAAQKMLVGVPSRRSKGIAIRRAAKTETRNS
jgi:transcriptional regulator with XRE-family HTH domain